MILHAPMTLTELLATYRTLFYSQHWYEGESFTRTLPNERVQRIPTKLAPIHDRPTYDRDLWLAVDIANAYVCDPTNPIFDDYILCRDRDALGQRVYVGGCANGKGFEIHRVIDYKHRLRRIVA